MGGTKARGGKGHHSCAKRKTSDEAADPRRPAGGHTKARLWIDDLRLGRVASFAQIAEHESQGERHIRLLAALAFVSPRIVLAIVEDAAHAHLTVTGLANKLPYSWAEQERGIGLVR